MVVVPGAARLIDGHTLSVDLFWQCSCEHDSGGDRPARVLERAERAGDLTLAPAARALSGSRHHQRLLSRLN